MGAARRALGGGLFVGVTYPPQQMPDYPFAALAPYVDAWAPMDYRHVGERGHSCHEVYTWVADSLATIDARTGRNDRPFDVIVQTFDWFADSGTGIFSPSSDELAGALAAAQASGAEGFSYYRFDHRDAAGMERRDRRAVIQCGPRRTAPQEPEAAWRNASANF